MKTNTPSTTVRRTARKNLAEALTSEILKGKYKNNTLLPSEHQLCRRFGVSRVTVRLALSDLENRGLIYRQHGKGTFAYPLGVLGRKPLAVLSSKNGCSVSQQQLQEITNGMTDVLAQSNSYLIITDCAPSTWEAAMASTIGGALVASRDIGASDLADLKRRGIPTMTLGFMVENIPSASFQVSKASAEITQILRSNAHERAAFVFREQRPIVEDALEVFREAFGFDQVSKACIPEGVDATRSMLNTILTSAERPSAIICCESDLAIASLSVAKRSKLLVPEQLSIIALFGDQTLSLYDSPINSLRWNLRQFGRDIATILGDAALRADLPESLELSYVSESGATLNGVPSKV